jgi:hypothetical protein
MVSSNRLLYAALGLVVCLAGFEFGYPFLESRNGELSGKVVLVRPGDPLVERRLFVIPQRTKAKAGVIKQLLAGRISLFEAAAWFRWLNETPPDCPGESIEHWPGTSPEEKLCRQMIAWVRNDQRQFGDNSAADALADRLEMELEKALAGTGRVVLPSLGDGTAGW